MPRQGGLLDQDGADVSRLTLVLIADQAVQKAKQDRDAAQARVKERVRASR